MAAITGLVNGGAALGVGAYIVTVAYKGNVKELGNLLYEETGYLDFVATLFILGAIQKYAPSKLGNILLVTGLMALALKTLKNNDQLGSKLVKITNDFVNGKASLHDIFSVAIGVK